jgi:glutamine synthetase
MKICLEYVWIDGYENTRSKLQIVDNNIFGGNDIQISLLPEWNFDGSSTGQAEGKDSDVLLKPVNFYPNPFINWCPAYLVLCGCYNKDGTPHITNTRVKLEETYSKCVDLKPLFGIEQEYVLKEYVSESNLEIKPYRWITMENPRAGPQGPYYCGVGGDVCLGRQISLKHLEYCMKMGLEICGTNGEVMASQWEYQIGPLEPVELSDQLWISRYVLGRVTEEFNCLFSLEPKPCLSGDWNGSGGHTNFSTSLMREEGGIKHIINACEKLGFTHKKHMEVYGKNNDMRLTGKHETSSINDFSWGISDRGKSIRIPLGVAKKGYGYLEDRRPAANLDPYLVTEIILRTVCLD